MPPPSTPDSADDALPSFSPAALRARCAGMARADFARAFGHPWLVHGLPRPPTSELSFRTKVGAGSGRVQVVGALSLQSEDITLFPVQKRAVNSWADRVSVGRARNNDVVLRHASVSKVHAHFTREPGGGWALSDARSTNGTFVNLRAAVPGQPVGLRDHAMVRFGQLRLTLFLDPDEVYAALVRRAAPEARGR